MSRRKKNPSRPGSHPLQTPQARPQNPSRQLQFQQVQFSGPLPLPAVLQGYNQVLPGLAERIVTMAETQQAMANKALDSDIADRQAGRREALIGQIFGLAIAIVTVLAGAYTATHGQPIAGAFIGAGGVASLAAVFVVGRMRSAPTQPPSQSN